MSTGPMRLPLPWIVPHRTDYCHAIVRTALGVAVRCLVPDQRSPAVSAAVVAIYAVTIVVFELRWRRMHRVAVAALDA